MENKNLEKKLARLEFINDQLTAELRYIDNLLRAIGFPEGLETIKSAAEEVIEQEEEFND